VYRRYGVGAKGEQRWFLVAIADRRVVGFLIGEVRDWEFGSPPCGWVFAIDVDPHARQAGIGTRLLGALTQELQRAGVRKLRTLLSHENTLILSFFRSQGMMAAPLIPLEMDVAP
jgi:ribosomal protein S18 acetylase RimI-like enzyme